MPANVDENHLLLDHPLTPSLLSGIVRWIKCESPGNGDAAEALSEIRRIAVEIIPQQEST